MIKDIEFKKINYPNGETGIEVLKFGSTIKLIFETNQDIIDLMMIANVLGGHCKNIQLIIIYFPYSRMDRIQKPGQCFSLKWFCEIINSMSFESVLVCDPHSNVLIQYLKNVVLDKGVFGDDKIDWFRANNYTLVCPDDGAYLKFPSIGHIKCRKVRDFDTGEITKTVLENDGSEVRGRKLIILDDICDGGRTFIEIAKILKPFHPESINLAVTHGFFTKGLEVFDGYIDNIFCLNGKLKLKRVK